MKQLRLSYVLKGIVITIALLGIFYLIGVPLLAKWLNLSMPGDILFGFNLFSWVTLFFCYVILFLFWNVCTQIGRGNSFSRENAIAFHRIGLCGIAIVLGFVAEFAWAFLQDYLSTASVLFIIFKTIVFLIFIVICEALSKLIYHAYEIRQENELTI